MADLKGFRELTAKLDQLKRSVRNRILRKAVTAAAGIVVNAAKAACPVETGQLRKSIGKRIKTYRRTGVVVGIVGPRTGFKNATTGRNPTKYSHLVEFGSATSAAKPFLRPAFDGNQSACLQKMAEVIEQELEQEARKAA